MTKTEKKIDKLISGALTLVCESAKEDVNGFLWLTHQVNFSKVSDSLVIRFMFESQTALSEAIEIGQTQQLALLSERILNQHDIKLTQALKQCRFEVVKAISK
ncbi:Fis family transcriptional regulator [Shewanella pneumatophori]|uniref:Fis family transcriptional regulator n=1 Tax=Shewanella pneumatophori TaxID=314092 RepID=A0A9X1Z925_9GAMM|nr:Fis family transcriptional regulator [Shewanella pneumatophori]MCL1137081.1 Fis family transcriptional regulator [Shewanella pneumatophori]